MAKKRPAKSETTVNPAVIALDDMEASLRHLDGLLTTFQILGEAGDSVEPIAISSLARCARETLKELEQNWTLVVGAIRSSD